jgi:ribosomal protein S18 acetylase RimI-like enzyme
MISLQKIENVYDTNFEELYDLYTSAFPSYQRRTWAGLETLFNKKPAFQSFTIKSDNEFVGLLNYWNFEKFVYVEHFAVHADYRNKGIGTSVMKEFLSKIELPVVIETETPRSLVASQRIHFYERLGFYMTTNFYMQPPYEGSQVMMSMLIMSNDYHFANKHFNHIKSTLYKEVYKYDPKRHK